MKKIVISCLCFCFLVLSCFLLSSCGRETVPVENFSYPENFELFKSQSTFLTPTIYPSNAYNFNISYTTSDRTIATVNERGFVTAVNYGQAVITCTITNVDGNALSKSCQVQVTDGEMFGIEIEDDSIFREYYEGQTFSLGDIKIYGLYQSGVRVEINSAECQIEIPNPLEIGSVLTITYQGFTDSLELNVVEDYITVIELVSPPTKSQYFIGDVFNSTGMEINSVWASGKKEILTDYEYYNLPLNYNDSSVTVTYLDFSLEIPITVTANYIVTVYSNLQSIIDNASSGDSIMISGTHFNVGTIYIPADKNLYILGDSSDNLVSITTRVGNVAFVITGQGSLKLSNLSLTSQDDTPIVTFEEGEENVNLTLDNVIYNYPSSENNSIASYLADDILIFSKSKKSFI